VLSKKWEIKIKKESGFSMKSKEQIEEVLMQEHQILDDKDTPMSEHEWANQSGWIEALEWVLGNVKIGEDFIPEAQLNESDK